MTVIMKAAPLFNTLLFLVWGVFANLLPPPAAAAAAATLQCHPVDETRTGLFSAGNGSTVPQRRSVCHLSLQTSMLNKHLSSLMPGLTAKVFRTYNASITLQQQLKILTNSKTTRIALP